MGGCEQRGRCATSGLTLWGVKIVDPFDTDNTDGFDPISGVCNFTVRDVYVSNGDDDSAIKSTTAGYATQNANYINIHKYSGLGMSIAVPQEEASITSGIPMSSAAAPRKTEPELR